MPDRVLLALRLRSSISFYSTARGSYASICPFNDENQFRTASQA